MENRQDQQDEDQQELRPDELLDKAKVFYEEGKLREARDLVRQADRKLKADPKLSSNQMGLETKALNALFEKENSSRNEEDFSSIIGGVIGLSGLILMGLGIAAFFSENIRALWVNYWYWLIASPYVIMLLGVLVRRLYLYFKNGESSQRSVLIILVVPLIVFTMLGLVVFPEQLATALELILILIVAFIPAAAYYLFLSTRRTSILKEFIANLNRLGLLRECENEPMEVRCARIESYFQRFEAIYGTLGFNDLPEQSITRSDFVELLIEAVDGRDFKNVQFPRGGEVRFSDMFRPELIIPIGILTILTTLGWLLVLQPELPVFMEDTNTVQENSPGDAAPVAIHPASTEDKNPIANITLNFTPVTFAFLGAYFFGIQMLFRRFVRRDLGPNAYFAFANRIIMAIIAVWVATVSWYVITQPGISLDPVSSETVSQTLAEPIAGSALEQPRKSPKLVINDWVMGGDSMPLALLVIGFLVGFFPKLLWQFLGAFTTKLPFVKVVLPSLEDKQPLSELDGLTVWHESRLTEEDVENIPNMATVDVVDLMLHTQIPAERLMTWIDQAILINVLGLSSNDSDKETVREKLRSLGIRTATQLVTANENNIIATTDSDHPDELNGRTLKSIVYAVKTEANFDLVRSWRRYSKSKLDQAQEADPCPDA